MEDHIKQLWDKVTTTLDLHFIELEQDQDLTKHLDGVILASCEVVDELDCYVLIRHSAFGLNHFPVGPTSYQILHFVESEHGAPF